MSDDRDPAVERDVVTTRAGVLGRLVEVGLVVDDARLRGIERERRHHREHAVVGRARAVEMEVREALDAIVVGEVARVVQEADRAERAVRIGPELDEAVRRRGADEAAAVGVAEPAATDRRIDERDRIGDLGQRWRRAITTTRDEETDRQDAAPHAAHSISALSSA